MSVDLRGRRDAHHEDAQSGGPSGTVSLFGGSPSHSRCPCAARLAHRPDQSQNLDGTSYATVVFRAPVISLMAACSESLTS
jgi:hypothetical protein